MKKIGIVTIHSDLHYGAALQAYALCAYLKEKGYETKIINYIKIPNVKYRYHFPKNIAYELMNYPRYIKYRRFLKSMVTKRKYKAVEDFYNFSEDFDVLCTGSDQVWNPRCGGLNKPNPVYFLNLKQRKYKKISYAASLGAYKYNNQEKEIVSKWINDYDHISVREEYSKSEIIRVSSYKQDIPVVIDPTFLLNKEDWSKICHNIIFKESYILIYHLDNISLIRECALQLKKKTGWKIVMMSNKLSRLEGVDVNVHFCGPKEFIGLIKNAQYILTDSFHGTAFSINFRKNFATILKADNPYRCKSLLDKAKLNDRLINNIQEFNQLPIETDYSHMEDLDAFINKSKETLLKFIEE